MRNPDLQTLYRLPWSTFNNPSGWIEPTTYCQLACPGCYRGLDQLNHPRVHEDLHKLKKEINTLVKIRNIQTLSIAGGEPLLYPKLNQLIQYAKKKSLAVKIISNGEALTKKRLEELKNLGTNEIVIHLAQYQNRGPYQSEGEANLLRAKYCQMFREVKGIDLQFIMTISKENINSLSDVIKFYEENSDVVSHFVFTLYQELFPEKKKVKERKLKTDEIRSLIEREYHIKPCAYLPKTLDHKLTSWLFYIPIFHGNKIIGYADKKTVEKLFKLKNKPKRKERFPILGNKINVLKTTSFVFEPQVRKMIYSYLLNIIKDPKTLIKLPTYQIIIIIDTPNLTQKGWSICDGCPDAMLYKNELVPSCLLERIKLGEKTEF